MRPRKTSDLLEHRRLSQRGVARLPEQNRVVCFPVSGSALSYALKRSPTPAGIRTRRLGLKRRAGPGVLSSRGGSVLAAGGFGERRCLLLLLLLLLQERNANTGRDKGGRKRRKRNTHGLKSNTHLHASRTGSGILCQLWEGVGRSVARMIHREDKHADSA